MSGTPALAGSDTHSPTLRRYHQMLWSKALPDGRSFALDFVTPHCSLHHRSEVGGFWLASDSVMQTFTRWAVTREMVAELSVDYGNRVDGKMTINGARGFTRRIADRLDLTLECIRLHYAREPSPLGTVLARHGDFFGLFTDFRGYVEFFLLQDLVDRAGGDVRFFMPFDGVASPSVPCDPETYREFLRRTTAFVEARNVRIGRWADGVRSSIPEPLGAVDRRQAP